MIRFVGDVHGYINRYYHLIKDVPYSIALGDVGFQTTYNMLNQLFDDNNIDPNNHKILRGNHDIIDENCAHQLSPFGLLNMDGINIFYIAGAESIDKRNRMLGYDYFEYEELSHEQTNMCIDLYTNSSIDIVCSHDCPEMLLSCIHNHVYTTYTSKLLQILYDIYAPKLWVFGHHHKTMEVQIDDTKFICLKELETFDFKSW